MGTEDAVVTHLATTSGQDVLKEAVEEIESRKGEMAGLLGAVIPVAECDQSIAEALQPVVGDGDAEDIAAEVIEDLFAGAGMLAMHDPGFVPELGRDLREKAVFVESGPHFGGKDLGERTNGNQKFGIAGLSPVQAIGGKAARGDQQMNMGVVEHSSSPGMQYGQGAKPCAEEARVVGKLL
jgi:hypothetical protein